LIQEDAFLVDATKNWDRSWLGLLSKSNGGLFRRDQLAGGFNRFRLVFRSSPGIFILELGGNDGLRGIALTETKSNLLAMVIKVKSQIFPRLQIILAGMQIPPNRDRRIRRISKEIYPASPKKKNVR